MSTGHDAGHNTAVRDRVLLYLTGLGVGDIESLELAAECLRRAQSGATAADAMRTLGGLLRERGLGVDDGAAAREHSFPPLNRRPMVTRRT